VAASESNSLYSRSVASYFYLEAIMTCIHDFSMLKMRTAKK
jgi:hypothetical protein